MEMKILTATLLRGYEWSVVPDQNLRPCYTPTNRPRDGLKIIFESKQPKGTRSAQRRWNNVNHPRRVFS